MYWRFRQSENYRKGLRFLKNRYEQVKMADCGGDKYIWFPASEPNPPDAEEVSIGGEPYERGEEPQ